MFRCLWKCVSKSARFIILSSVFTHGAMAACATGVTGDGLSPREQTLAQTYTLSVTTAGFPKPLSRREMSGDLPAQLQLILQITQEEFSDRLRDAFDSEPETLQRCQGFAADPSGYLKALQGRMLVRISGAYESQYTQIRVTQTIGKVVAIEEKSGSEGPKTAVTVLTPNGPITWNTPTAQLSDFLLGMLFW